MSLRSNDYTINLSLQCLPLQTDIVYPLDDGFVRESARNKEQLIQTSSPCSLLLKINLPHSWRNNASPQVQILLFFQIHVEGPQSLQVRLKEK